MIMKKTHPKCSKCVKTLFFVTLLCVCAAVALGLAACQKDAPTSWNVGDNVQATLADNGNYGYVLTISGSGAMRDYPLKEVPWYGVMGRVQQVVVSNGVTHIGSNSFFGSPAKQIALPISCTSVGVGAFSPDVAVFAYNTVDVGEATLYLFSQNKPSDGGNYWHDVGGVPTVWKYNYKVMFVGNSFTYREDIPNLFKQVAESFGELQVQVTGFAVSSYRLVQWADLSDAEGKKLDAALHAADDYDIVVLQEQSSNPINNFAEFEQGATKLVQKVRSTQKNCQTVLYATWGYDKSNPKSAAIPTMEAKLRSAYQRVADELGVRVSPVGAAFTAIFNDGTINLYNSEDNHHQNYTGAMLAAYVHAETLFGLDVMQCPFNGTLDSATATLLKQVAHSVVTQS